MTHLLVASALSWGRTTLLELVWFLIGLAGMAVSLDNARDARRYVVDAASLKPNGHTEGELRLMRLIAVSHHEQELWRIFKFSTIIATGAAAMVAPPANRHDPISTLQIITVIGIFLLGVGMLGAAYSERVYRQRLRADT